MSLVLEQIEKSYLQPDGVRLPVLQIPEFRLQSGEQVALVGQSGGGKTTLLNVISGITTPDKGRVIVDGVDIARLPETKRDRFRAQKIGFVFQTFNLLKAFTALENVLLGMTFSGRTPNQPLAEQLLDKVGLSHRLHHRPGRMSVCEQQRVAVARALANRPKLLLADEPTANVDIGNQETILKLIREACTENNVSLLLVTHTPDIANRFSRIEKLSEFNRVLR